MKKTKSIWLENEIYDLYEELYRRFYWEKSKVVLTGGYFQVLHSGHINLLEESAKFGQCLVVVINNDEATVKKSGYSFLPIEERLKVVSSLRAVDYVIDTKDNNCLNALRVIQPDIYTKGSNITENNILKEERIQCELGLIPIIYGVGGFEKVNSSSSLLEKYYQWRKNQ